MGSIAEYEKLISEAVGMTVKFSVTTPWSTDWVPPCYPTAEDRQQAGDRILKAFPDAPGWVFAWAYNGLPYVPVLEGHCPHGRTVYAAVDVNDIMEIAANPEGSQLAHQVAMQNWQMMRHLCVQQCQQASASASPIDDLAAVFPGILQIVCCPVQEKARRNGVLPPCDDLATTMPIGEVIVHLNDAHRWTREQIADWLDTLDADLTIQPATQGD